MPGSVTISHHEMAVMLSHDDAKRLATVLDEIAYLLEIPGPDRLSDAQVTALCEGRAQQRGELSQWTRGMAAELKERLQERLQ
ncbi:hypothetical protein [Kitasatospora sp. NPDC050543]|uniref:hypothetical protein n=1 Tax=Kitasatospora sp. NPDC050543 TaxID=3364054 RepID=UPI0037B95AB4